MHKGSLKVLNSENRDQDLAIPPKKKIMHITQALGGIQTYLQYLVTYSNKNEFDCIIAAPFHPSFQKFCASFFVRYYPLNVKREINPFSDLLFLLKIIRLIRKEKPQVIHVHSAKGGFLGRLAGLFSNVKVIYTPHGFSYLSFTGLKRMFFFTLECMSRNWSNVLLAVSYSEANRAIFELGYNPNNIKVIPNAISFNENLTQRDYTKNYRIGMIGRLTIQKNPFLFLDIAKILLQKYPGLQFQILGAGLDDHLGFELNSFIAQNALTGKIKLLPWGDNATSNKFLEETDIYVMTSVFEGLPYSLLEAMASGCACVVSKCDGNTDVIQNNINGFSCLTRGEFCNSIELLIENISIRERLGIAGMNYVKEKHDIRTATEQLGNIYSHL